MFKFVVKRNTTELFHRAVSENDFLRVKLLLEQAKEDEKFSINGINSEGLTALQTSCFAGNLDIVKLLFENGANLKIKDRDGWTLLHAAAMAGKFDIVVFLAEHGLSVSQRNDRKQLPIDFAEELPVIMFLLKQMLKEGLEEDVHRYIRRNPKLKKEIYKEVELAIHMKKQEIKALERLPYTPQDARRKRNSTETARNMKNPIYYSTRKQPETLKIKKTVFHDGTIPVSPKSSSQDKDKRTSFILDVDDLPPTPTTPGMRKRWSSMSNIPTNFEKNYSEVKIHMHNGYETDGTQTQIYNNNNNHENRVSKTDQDIMRKQSRNNETREMDIASVNSHSTSGYETDDIDHQLYLPQNKIHSEGGNEIVSFHRDTYQHSDYQQKSKTLSPRTLRRLEHRFGTLALNDAEVEFGRSQLKKTSKNLKRIEYPEVFL
eukprot:gene18774-20665_t